MVSSWEKELLVRRYGIPEHSVSYAQMPRYLCVASPISQCCLFRLALIFFSCWQLQLAPFYYDEPPGLQELPGWDRRYVSTPSVSRRSLL